MSTILIDADYVTLDLETKWLRLYNHDYDDCLKVSDIKEWAIHKFVKPECGKKIYDYLLLPDLYDDIELTPGAQEGITLLKQLDYRCVIVSSGIHRGKYLRLKQLGIIEGEADYVCAHDKNLIMGDYLIDDAIHNIQGFKNGIGILFNAPHNQGFDTEYRVYDWGIVPTLIRFLDAQNKIKEINNYFMNVNYIGEGLGFLRERGRYE